MESKGSFDGPSVGTSGIKMEADELLSGLVFSFLFGRI
jgi:hypothetical protein